MSTSTLRGILAVCVLAMGSLAVLGAPLRRTDVAAEPTWALHINCDALRPTAVGKYLLSEMAKPEVEPSFAAFQSFFSFDPRQRLHGVTFYSTGNAQDDGVLLIYANFDTGRLAAVAKSARDSQSTNYGAHVIYSWRDERTVVGKGKVRFYAAIEGDRIVIGQRRPRVQAALDVLDHAKPALSDNTTFPELGSAGDLNFIEASARKVELADSAPTAALFRLSKAMKLQVGETNHVVNATLNFQAVNEDIANQAIVMVKGAVAFARLQKERPEAGKLAEGLTISREGEVVTAVLALPEDEVIELLKTTAEKDSQKKAGKD